MKGLIAAALLVPMLAFAKPAHIALTFNGVSLVAFGEGTFKAILQRDFVIAPDVLAMDRRITINVKAIEFENVSRFVEDLLAREGIQTTLRQGIYYLTAKRDAGQAFQNTQQETHAPVSSSEPQPTASPTHVASKSSDASTGDVPIQQMRKDDDEVGLCEPMHRTSEFVAGVLVAGFGRQAANLAGGRIVMTGSKSTVAKMKALCVQLDEPAKMVDVSASWIEVTHTDGQARGISLAATVLGAKLGASIGAVNGTNAVSLRNTRFELVIDALNADSRFKQVSNSRLVGEDREHLNLTVGDEAPTVGSSGSDNAGNRVQNIVYRPSGLIIDVQPKVLGSGRINMDIDAQISSFKATSTGVSGSPTLIKRQVKTKVAMSDGDVMLLGGLEDSQATETSSGLAFLPASWSVRSGSKVKTDLVLIVSAKVLPN
jgi:general secretion pathway protein D